MVLRVILQIVPFGEEDKTREIGRLDIFNKGRVDGNLCKYGVIQLDPGQEGLYQDVVYHMRNLSAWELVGTVLDELEVE